MGTDLHHAARTGDLVAVTGAIAEGADLDVRDQYSRTPLILAAWSGHLNCVKVLIAANAQVNLGAQDDMNALHFAVQKGNLECVKYLLESGAKVNSKNGRNGNNALIMAAQHGHKEVVELLLKKKADPSARNRAGKTARQMCKEGEEEIAALLEGAEKQRAQQLAEEAKKRKEKNAKRTFAPQVAVPVLEKSEMIGPSAPPQSESTQVPVLEESIPQLPVAKKPKVTLNYDDDDD